MTTTADGTIADIDARAVLDMRAARFLSTEARLLDELRYDDWLATLDPDIAYEVPVRSTLMDGGAGFSTTSFLMREDLYTLKMRVERLRTKYAWAEDPPSRNRHIVSNVVADALDDGLVEVRSSVLLVRTRLDQPHAELLTADRTDLLRTRPDGTFRLAKRVAYVDQTTLQISAITTFL